MTQEERKLREQLLGVRLIAQEMADEVATARFAFHAQREDDVRDALGRLDELLEPLLQGKESS